MADYNDLLERARILKANVPMEFVIEGIGGEVHEAGWSGWTKTTCPFHGDHSPSASISPDSTYFHCRGCEVHGDIFGVLRQGKIVKSFSEAVEWVDELARNLGVSTTDNS